MFAGKVASKGVLRRDSVRLFFLLEKESKMLFQVTITTTNVPQKITTSTSGIATAANQLTFQNNGTNSMRIGNDSTVSATKGIKLNAGGNLTSTFSIRGILGNWYVVGTAGDVLDILATS